MIYDGICLDELLLVEKVDNPPLPAIQITTQSAPGKNGARFVSKKLSTRTIKVDITVAGKTRADYMEQVQKAAAILHRPDVARLEGLPGDQHYYWATLSRWTMQKLMQIGNGSMEFFCSDPVAYGDNRALPLNADVVIKGSLPVQGVIRQFIEEPLTDGIMFTLEATGETLRVFGSFDAGDLLIIDTGKGYATLNGVSIMDRVDIAVDWFACHPGPARILSTPGTVMDGTYTYQEQWL